MVEEADFEDAAATAQAILRAANFDGDDEPDPVLVARRLGVRVVTVPRHKMRLAPASTARADGRWIICVRADITDAMASFLIGHELGHVIAREWRLNPPDEERWANAVSGGLLCPPQALRRAWNGDVRDLIGRWSHVPPTCVVLALGEARLADMLVTEGSSLRYSRSSAAVRDEHVATGVEAARTGSSDRPGLARGVRLADGRRRAAVVIDAA